MLKMILNKDTGEEWMDSCISNTSSIISILKKTLIVVYRGCSHLLKKEISKKEEKKDVLQFVWYAT